MSVRKLPDNKVTKDGRAYAFYINEYGLDGKRHQHQSKAYMSYEEAVQAEKDYINKYKDIEINPHITFYQAYQKVYDYKKDKIRPTTLKTYRDRIVFMKLFWDVELVDLDSDLYQRWRNQLNKTNLSDRYKTDIQKLIKTICNFAEKQWDFNLRKFYNKLEPFKTPGAINLHRFLKSGSSITFALKADCIAPYLNTNLFSALVFGCRSMLSITFL